MSADRITRATWGAGAALLAGAAGDVASTWLVLRRGGVEGNGLVVQLAGQPWTFLAVKAWVAATCWPLWWALHRVRPWLLAAGLAVCAVGHVPIVVHNVRLAASIGRDAGGLKLGPAAEQWVRER